MRKEYFKTILATTVLTILLNQIAQAQWEEIAYDKPYFFEQTNDVLLKNTFVENETYSDWDLTYNCLKLDVDPGVFYLSGSVDFEFTAKTNGLKSVTIDLNNALKVKSVTSGTQNLSFNQKDGTVIINLSSVINKNTKGRFTIKFEGIPNTSGFGSITLTYQNDNTPVLSTLSEPYGARDWWPCKQSLADKIDSLDVIVQTPSEYRTASNGILVADSVVNGKRTCHWKHRHPIATYLVFFSSTIYDTYTEEANLDDGSKVEILNYVYPDKSEAAKKLTPIAKDYLEFYSRMFIDYPFKDEKYGHAQFGWGGGMEHQTMSSMGSFSSALIAHEMAHQWFGDYITCGTWSDIWLNEGFATFLESMTYQEFDHSYWLKWKAIVINTITSSNGGSVYCNDTTKIGRIFDSRLSYKKGAFVLYMLKSQLGDLVFFNGMKNYLTDQRVINGFASTDLFREDMEEAADTSLVKFFNDWVYGEGFPVYDISWRRLNDQLSITVNQYPSVSNGPFFEMKLPFTIYKNGSSETVWLKNDAPSQEFLVSSFSNPDSVVFNQDNYIVCKQITTFTSFHPLSSGGITARFSPSEKSITIFAPGIKKGYYTIFDLRGKEISSGKWEQNNPFLSPDKPGIYLLHFSSPEKSTIIRIPVF